MDKKEEGEKKRKDVTIFQISFYVIEVFWGALCAVIANYYYRQISQYEGFSDIRDCMVSYITNNYVAIDRSRLLNISQSVRDEAANVCHNTGRYKIYTIIFAVIVFVAGALFIYYAAKRLERALIMRVLGLVLITLGIVLVFVGQKSADPYVLWLRFHGQELEGFLVSFFFPIVLLNAPGLAGLCFASRLFREKRAGGLLMNVSVVSLVVGITLLFFMYILYSDAPDAFALSRQTEGGILVALGIFCACMARSLRVAGKKQSGDAASKKWG